MKPESLDQIREAIAKNELTSPQIVFEKTLKAVSEIWPTDEQIEHAVSRELVRGDIIKKWLRRWLKDAWGV